MPSGARIRSADYKSARPSGTASVADLPESPRSVGARLTKSPAAATVIPVGGPFVGGRTANTVVGVPSGRATSA